MKTDFWLQRWREGQTGFHQSRVMPLLQKYWPSLALPAGSRVLVPLSGKSLDILWLAEQGHRVLAVELSPLAVEQFFAENKLHPDSHDTLLGRHFIAGNIEVICGDIFSLDAATLAECAGVYDRAALIALPPAMRQRYVQHIYGQLPPQCRGLLITLDYPQQQMDGPPFAVLDAEVQSLYAGTWRIQAIDQRDVLDKEPKFAARGLTHMRTVVYRLDK
ncbi:thiopurine S-methyltransferase [Paralcaligenes sp. KSB-10]|uniref:thiopurine S-methyltransferase n=1 Tax=Paralcaligenes sp. KSB-10 TaxID=2901142 RepID=UPI001E4E0F11|nr:thiopurine S-methyltransferase [Paralcaligenes sp. KSB-10]UHL62677.1 thiopurine S-methyltransferase [Paralcaligenes sp. KSB-10]